MNNNDVDAAIAENMRFTLDLAGKILDSAGTDLHDAFTKAVGTLAQVIYVTTHDDRREETLRAALDALRNYLKLLDEVGGRASQKS